MTDVMEQTTETAGEVDTSITFSFSPRQFAAIQGLTTFCDHPTKGFRPILKGVHFNRHNGTLRLEATDSYALGILEFSEFTKDFTPFIVPATLLNKVKLSAKDLKGFSNAPTILVTYLGPEKRVTVSYDGAQWVEEVVEGPFPSLQHVLDSLPVEPVEMGVIGLNPQYLVKIGKWFKDQTLRFSFGGDKCVTITSHFAFQGLDLEATAYLMPVRLS